MKKTSKSGHVNEIHSGSPENLHVWSPAPGKWIVDDHGRFYPKGIDRGNAPFNIEVPTRELAVRIRDTAVRYYLGDNVRTEDEE